MLFTDVKKSYYETLGIAKTASEAEIKRAYFGLVRKYQPDRFPEEFKEIRAAYETLSDGQKRAEYDAIGNIPSSVAPLFHEAQRLDRFGRHTKAAELYQTILKSHPELDNVREQYAKSLTQDNKTGKAGEVWEELCRRHPDNAYYARELGDNYVGRGWHKKAHAEIHRSLTLDRSCADGWSLLISCTLATLKNNPDAWNKLRTVCREALDAVKDVKVNEWEKIHIYTQAFLSGGPRNAAGRGYLQEIVRLTREGGQNGREEGRRALQQILLAVPAEGLAEFYPEVRELTDLLPDMNNKRAIRSKLEDVKLNFQINELPKNKFPELLYDLLVLLTTDFESEDDELEILAMEYMIIDEKRTYDPQLRRLKEEFPELYALHSSFFNEVLRTRDPDKMLYQRAKKLNKLRRRSGIPDEDPRSAPPDPVRRAQPKVGRNDPCPCGSGKKYKRCCGA